MGEKKEFILKVIDCCVVFHNYLIDEYEEHAVYFYEKANKPLYAERTPLGTADE